MVKTQIQIPEPLYKDLKRVAKQLDWSLAEALRRGGELLVARYPMRQNEQDRKFPAPLDLGVPPLISLEGFNAEAEAIEYKTLNDLGNKWKLPGPYDLGEPLISIEGWNAEAEAIEHKLTHKE